MDEAEPAHRNDQDLPTNNFWSQAKAIANFLILPWNFVKHGNTTGT